MRLVSILLLALGLAACNASSTGGVDAAVVVDSSADGGGVCCPRDPSPCSNARLGGWAPTLADCPGPSGAYDGYWSSGESGGCPVWIDHGTFAAPGAMCCGCVAVDSGALDAGP